MRKRLRKYNIPEPILQRWQDRYGGKLLPLQYRAVEEYGLLDGQSLLISAPTSSGKTFCGELAVVRAAMERKKGIFLTPLKAVSEEKYRQFVDCYGKLGLRVVIATRDHPEFDADIENGRFDIAVMVYEKFNSLLLTNFDLMGQVGALIIDELQMLEEKGRGSQLELALTKLLYSSYNPQIIALSAVLGEATDLADWLGCRLLLDKARPVELRRGVVADGRFYFRCHNSGETGDEGFKSGEDHTVTLFENIRESVEADQQALVFLKSRRDTTTAAARFAEYTGLSPSDTAREFFEPALEDEEPSSLLDNLKSLLLCGVAFHNADLTARQREIVEEGYRKGLIKVVFATTTLSTGINLPAATVFIEAQKYRPREHSNKPGLEPLSWSEYESMSGRAGRVGWAGKSGDEQIGRAVLFAANDLEKSILWDFYVEKKPSPLESRLDHHGKGDLLVDLFSSGLVESLDDVSRLLSLSYYTRRNSCSINIKEDIIKQLLEDGFLIERGGKLSATPMGKWTAVTGLSLAGAQYIINHLDSFQGKSDMQLINCMLLAPDGRGIFFPNGRGGASGRAFGQPPGHFDENDPLLQEISSLRREPTPEERSRLRLTFLLADWMQGMSALDIESQYNLHVGMMTNLARQAGWLFSSSSSIIRTFDRFSRLPNRLNRLAFSVATGLPLRLKELYDDLGDFLFRHELLKLDEEGIATIDHLIESDHDFRKKIISSEKRRHKLEAKLNNIKEKKMQALSNRNFATTVMPESLDIIGTPIRERYTIRINGHQVNLTGKSFKYLVSLAWSRVTKTNGWLYKEELEQGFNQARYLYRLRQEIGKDFMPSWPLYENNRSGYYRLMVDREKIKINVDELRNNPDFEIQQMAIDLTPKMTS